ncbi:MAG TPA: DUF6258 family protein [Alphaproteobacteria bacterium]|nr:hypothetical protein [Alphaproteobacteria bacterium]HOO50947.1 DUF6258 family protein [Alphaproteobacteria bacterium]
MDVIEFISTVYLGDRGCRSILIDSWESEVKIGVDCISRVRSENWDCYIDEDIRDGYLVFENVRALKFDPAGYIPNDAINDMRAEALKNGVSKYLITMSIDSVDDLGDRTEVKISIHADSMALETSFPSERIVR